MNLLSTSRYNVGIVKSIGRTRGGYNVTLTHRINREKIESENYCPESIVGIHEGDSVLIRYSIKNTSVVDIVNNYWKENYYDSIGLEAR